MKKVFLISLLLFIMNWSFAQTGIGTTTPHASAKLDVTATNKGFLPPRVALLSTTDVATITSPATGLVVYNTNTAGSTPNNVIPGYYYWDGAKWNGLVGQDALQSFSGYVPNYAQSNASSVTKSAVGDIIVSQSITTSGRPVQIIATGDANPQTNGAWVQLQIFRDGTAIGKKIQAESSSSNENVPYCLNFIDNPTVGTYTYSVRITAIGGGSYQFGEADGNQLTLLELGAWSAGIMPVSKGGTGNSSYTTGSLLFSDGTNIVQNNSKIFWDNTNNRLGVGTSTPGAPLEVNGAINSSTVNLSNTTSTPSLVLKNGDAAAAYGDNAQIKMGWAGSAAGTSQYAQYIHTRHNAGSTNNAIDFYLSDGTANNTITSGSTKAMSIESPGNLTVAGKINLTDPSGNVAVKAAGYVNAGSFVTLDNIKATVSTSGSRGLCIATVSGSIVTYMAGVYGMTGGSSGGASNTAITFNTSLSSSIFGWSFGSVGDTPVYYMNDTTNNRFYRITLMIGYGYNNNFICIERLH